MGTGNTICMQRRGSKINGDYRTPLVCYNSLQWWFTREQSFKNHQQGHVPFPACTIQTRNQILMDQLTLLPGCCLLGRREGNEKLKYNQFPNCMGNRWISHSVNIDLATYNPSSTFSNASFLALLLSLFVIASYLQLCSHFLLKTVLFFHSCHAFFCVGPYTIIPTLS